jgi:cholesterol transport system auxiliary component
VTRGLVLLVLAGLACAGSVPPTRYYQLTPGTAPAVRPARGSVALTIEPLVADAAYDDERIVYRVSPYRLDYYTYHRWSAPPGTLVADHLETALERSGRFRSVTRELGAGASPAPVMLSGRVVAIEEVDVTPERWLGRITLELSLTDTQSGDVVWTQQFTDTEPLPARSPEGLARALSVALDRIAARALPEIVAQAEHRARVQEARATERERVRERPRRRRD